jgi:hypothetical protein
MAPCVLRIMFLNKTVMKTANKSDQHPDTGKFLPGNNAHRAGAAAKAARLEAKITELASEFEGALSALSAADAGRLKLAAKHFLIAEDSRDPNECTRSTRTGELLLSKIKPREAPVLSLEELGLA